MAKSARSEKRVLSKQSVASRKRSLAEDKPKADSVGRRALLGVLLLAGSMLAFCSLATFDPRDRIGPGFRNAVGPTGHALAEILLGSLGFCAYVVPIAGGYASMVLFVGSRGRRRWPQLLAAGLWISSSSVLAQLIWSGRRLGYPPGGALGVRLAAALEELFSTVGTWIIVSAACAAALILGTRLAFLKLCSGLWRGASLLGQTGLNAAVAFIAEQRRAFLARREKGAKARLEEAAFFAQLEADEDQLSEAERAAAEADDIAEEATRLAKEVQSTAPMEKRVRKAPVQADASPAEPAWATSLAAPSDGDRPKKRDRRPTQLGLTGPAPAGSSTIEAAVAAAAAEPETMATAVATSASALALRLPIIVEPKPPPKPSKKEQEPFQFVGDRKSFTLPPLDVLEWGRSERSSLDKDAFLTTAEKLRDKLADFGIGGDVVEIRPGPVVTMYEFLPGPGIKISKIASLADDLAMAMEAMRVRIVAPIPGKGVVGIEVPNKDRETVYLREIAEQDLFAKSPSKLTMCLGKDIEGMPYVLDLAKAPHLLIAGTTGSGKSVAVNAMVMSILLKATPEEVRFVMVDPKMLELSVYEGIPHLLLPVVTDPKKAALALRWSVEEMERRYHLLSEVGVRNIAGYNKLVESAKGNGKELLKVLTSKTPNAPIAVPGKPKKMLVVDVAEGESEEEALARAEGRSQLGVPAPKDDVEDIRTTAAEPSQPPASGDPRVHADTLPVAEETSTAGAKARPPQKLPYIVVIIDELADLMMVASREVETYIARLAQMARAAGIHLLVATQRPSTDVVTGIIKANFPTRISFMLRSKPDSMTILGTTGAESLLGMGDMLIMPPTSAHMQRVHGAYVSEVEIKRVVDHLKAQGKPVYDESILRPREEDLEGAGEEDQLSDELYDQALAVVSDMRQVSISMLQRKMRIGYNRAARMIERMERDGLVGPADGAKPREVRIRPIGEMPGSGAF